MALYRQQQRIEDKQTSLVQFILTDNYNTGTIDILYMHVDTFTYLLTYLVVHWGQADQPSTVHYHRQCQQHRYHRCMHLCIIEQRRKAMQRGDLEECWRLAGPWRRWLRHNKQQWADQTASSVETHLLCGEISKMHYTRSLPTPSKTFLVLPAHRARSTLSQLACCINYLPTYLLNDILETTVDSRRAWCSLQTVAWTYKVRTRPLSGKYITFSYLTFELFRSVRKTCSCIHSGQLILKRISKTGATRCQILRLKTTKFGFGSGSTPDPGGGAYSALPDSLAGFKWAYFWRVGGRRGEEKGRGEKRKEREGRGERPYAPPVTNSWLRHWLHVSR